MCTPAIRITCYFLFEFDITRKAGAVDGKGKSRVRKLRVGCQIGHRAITFRIRGAVWQIYLKLSQFSPKFWTSTRTRKVGDGLQLKARWLLLQLWNSERKDGVSKGLIMFLIFYYFSLFWWMETFTFACNGETCSDSYLRPLICTQNIKKLCNIRLDH